MSYIQSFEGISPTGEQETMTKIFIDAPATLRFSDCINSIGNHTLQFYIRSETNAEINIEGNGIYRFVETTDEWNKYIFTFTVSNTSDSGINITFPIGLYYMYHVKLELGDVASEWTPAPEVSSEIEDASEDSRLFKLNERYVDKIGCQNGDWYIERNTELLVLDGAENWEQLNDSFALSINELDDNAPALSDRFENVLFDEAQDNTFYIKNEIIDEEKITYLCIRYDSADSIEAFKTWLTANNTKVLIPRSEPLNTPLANYLQLALDDIRTNENLVINVLENNVSSTSGAVLTKPLIFGYIKGNSNIEILNMSDDEIGFIYEIHCKGDVINPIIFDGVTNDFIRINGTFKNNDIISIDTRQSKKSIIKSYKGIITNIINNLGAGSTWLQLRSGTNQLLQTADSGADLMDSKITYTNEYEGV